MSAQQELAFLKLAIENSKRSFAEGNFPAGAVVVQNGKVISSEISSPYPGLFHADSKAVQSAFNTLGGPTKDGILYVTMEPCLMCTSVAYWGGIRRIVYAVGKNQVDPNYYETADSTDPLTSTFHERIEKVHISELEEEALVVIREWEEKNKE